MHKPVSFVRFIIGFGVAILTMAVLFGAANVVADRTFSDGSESTLACLNVSDPVNAVTAKPHTVCRQKLPESPVIEYRFNACGHRTNAKCHLDGATGNRRIVLLGSSLVEGYGVPMEASFASRLPAALQRAANQSVDVYNEAMQWGVPRSVALRIDEAIREKPLAVIWPVTPFDIQNASLRLPYLPNIQQGDLSEDAPVRAPASSASVASVAPVAAVPDSLVDRLAASYRKHGAGRLFSAASDRVLGELRQSKAVFAAQHFTYLDQHEFIKHFLGNRSAANYLFAQPDPVVLQQLDTFGRYYSRVSAALKDAGIPLYVMLVPSHPQVSLLSGSAGDFPETDPRLLDREIRGLVLRQGDHYVDLFDSFTRVGDPANYFYAVDEHANERGHALMATVLADRLASDTTFMTVLANARSGAPEASR